ncbi:MAG: TetR/AcrR family transcriptional regulator [Actinomycetota bacterium]|nr:TetR/AcrR family transcriptional regulator [Actinomycetota bacterium]
MTPNARRDPSGGSADTDLSGFRHGRVPRLVRERQLLALAEDLFAERGLSAASTDELARRCRSARTTRERRPPWPLRVPCPMLNPPSRSGSSEDPRQRPRGALEVTAECGGGSAAEFVGGLGWQVVMMFVYRLGMVTGGENSSRVSGDLVGVGDVGGCVITSRL